MVEQEVGRRLNRILEVANFPHEVGDGPGAYTALGTWRGGWAGSRSRIASGVVRPQEKPERVYNCLQPHAVVVGGGGVFSMRLRCFDHAFLLFLFPRCRPSVFRATLLAVHCRGCGTAGVRHLAGQAAGIEQPRVDGRAIGEPLHRLSHHRRLAALRGPSALGAWSQCRASPRPSVFLSFALVFNSLLCRRISRSCCSATLSFWPPTRVCRLRNLDRISLFFCSPPPFSGSRKWWSFFSSLSFLDLQQRAPVGSKRRRIVLTVSLFVLNGYGVCFVSMVRYCGTS